MRTLDEEDDDDVDEEDDEELESHDEDSGSDHEEEEEHDLPLEEEEEEEDAVATLPRGGNPLRKELKLSCGNEEHDLPLGEEEEDDALAMLPRGERNLILRACSLVCFGCQWPRQAAGGRGGGLSAHAAVQRCSQLSLD